MKSFLDQIRYLTDLIGPQIIDLFGSNYLKMNALLYALLIYGVFGAQEVAMYFFFSNTYIEESSVLNDAKGKKNLFLLG
jgi:hypothetical protein